MAKKESFIIQGLAGEKSLSGKVSINGAKNAVLKAMAASVLFDGPVTLEKVAKTADVGIMCEVLTKLGAKVERRGADIIIDPTPISSTGIDGELAGKMRSSVVLTGPLLSRYGSATFPAPGGCVIGARPIDLFIEGYAKLGATTKESKDFYDIRTAKLMGTTIEFKKISVGATETLMMAAALASGTTILQNCAREPEIANVGEWLNACGAHISGLGTSTITIEGTEGKLLKAGTSFKTIPDRIEAGSFLILGALCASELAIENCQPKHLEALIDMLKLSGVPISVGETSIHIKGNTKPNSSFKAISEVVTREYPGFATDLQAPLVAFLTQTDGESRVTETIFEGRFKYTEDLTQMGANITMMNPQEILIKGPASLRALPAQTGLPDDEEVRAHDIRAGFAIVLAALVGKGKFTVNNIHLIDRGYEKLEERLKALGANIERVS